MGRYATFLLMSVFLSVLSGSPCLGQALVLDNRPHQAITQPLPTIISNEHSQTPSNTKEDPAFWLAQNYSLEPFTASIQPSPYASWHKVELLGQFSDEKIHQKIVVVNSHILRHLSFYLYSDQQLIKSKHMGLLDKQVAPIHYNNPHFSIPIKNGQHLTLLISKQNDGPSLLPLDIYSEQEHKHAKRRQNIFWGAVIAVLLAMALYNVLVYAMHPNRAYLWYMAFHGTAFVYFSALNGFGYWIWPREIQIFLMQNIMAMNYFLIFLIVNFASVFLEAKRYTPKHHKCIPWLVAISVVGTIARLFVTEYNMIPIFSVLQLVGSVFGLSMGYQALKEKFYPARYFLLSWAFTILGGAIGMATFINVLPANFFTLHCFLFGTLTELFLLSVGLASRIKHMEIMLLSQSYVNPDNRMANFSYLKQILPKEISNIFDKNDKLAVIVANMKGLREVVSLYGPKALSDIEQYFINRTNHFLCQQNWSVELPLPTGESVYLMALPGRQICLLVNVDNLHANTKVKSVLEEFISELENTVNINDMEVNLHFELGYSFINHVKDFQECYRQAQTALLNGEWNRSKYQIYNPIQDETINERLWLMHELKKAINQEALQIFIQPQVSIPDQILCGGEMLIRWQHPLRGSISPGQFIMLAETSGLIYPITQLVIKKTCLWLQHIGETHKDKLDDFSVSINLSALDMAQDNLLNYFQSCLNQYQVEAKNIMLEVTESAIMDNPDQFLTTIKQLKAAGFKISIDDFGTGYSSMQYLQTMQADEIKIDLAFIHNIHLNKTNQNIVKAIIQLAHSTHAHTVAEGVQCTEEAEYLSKLNCHIAQGFYWSPAIPLPQFERDFLNDHSHKT